MRDEGTVRNKAVYLAIGVTPDGRKNVLGLWTEPTEDANFWLRVMTELKNRGVNDVLIAVVDGLKGFAEAINAVFPLTQIEIRIVQRLRNSMEFAGWKERKLVATALKTVYRAVAAVAASVTLTEFEEGPWGRKYPAISASWQRNWEPVPPFFAYPQDVRRIIYTTNAIENLKSTIRRSVRARGHVPTDEAAMRLIGRSCEKLRPTGRRRHASGIQRKRSSLCCSVIGSR